MHYIRKLVITEHWRKKYVLGLFVVIGILGILSPLLSSISLGQGDVVNQSLQHFAIELVGVLFLVYFGSSSLHSFYNNKTIQLLWSKKKQPLQFILGLRGGTYTIYALFVLAAGALSSLYYMDSSLFLPYINLLVSGAILLSIVLLLSFFINSYASLLASLVIYLISYSINYILFSTPSHFETSFSFKVLNIVKYLFPRFDILYSSIGSARRRGISGNMLYFFVISTIMVLVFLYRSQ